jgi:hypothetical protein
MEFDEVIAQGAELQQELPWLELVAVGGTSAAIHCHHRFSLDVDCVAPQLTAHFESVADSLKQWPHWKTNRLQRPVLILGERHAVELGIRQLRRKVPLRALKVQGLWVPTPEEALRIKAYLCVQRTATRDFLDVAALVDHLGESRALEALKFLNLLYPEPHSNLSCCSAFAKACFSDPIDAGDIDLERYKGVVGDYRSREYIMRRCRALGTELAAWELSDVAPPTMEQFYRHEPASHRVVPPPPSAEHERTRELDL